MRAVWNRKSRNLKNQPVDTAPVKKEIEDEDEDDYD
jgi:hypothetical protein